MDARRLFHCFRYFCYKFYHAARSQQYARNFLKRYKLHTPTTLLALTGFSYKNTLSDELIANELNTVDNIGKSKTLEDGWELVTEEKDYQVLRRALSSSIYEYRCSGTYHDITARSFIEAQCDLPFRKGWDHNVITLTVLETNPQNETEIIKWVSKYPYPMSARVYYYIRRKKIDYDYQKIVVLSQALDEKEYPTEKEDEKYVRVTTYKSNMVVKAHTKLDENGFDYVLTYYDDPKASIPNTAYAWIVSYGGPTFLKHVHDAAINWQKDVYPKIAKTINTHQPIIRESKSEEITSEQTTPEVSIKEITDKMLTKLAQIRDEVQAKAVEVHEKETKDEATQTERVVFIQKFLNRLYRWGEIIGSKIEKLTDPYHPEKIQQPQQEINKTDKEKATAILETSANENASVPPSHNNQEPKVQKDGESRPENIESTAHENTSQISPASPQPTIQPTYKTMVEIEKHSPLEVVQPNVSKESDTKANEQA